MQNSSFWVGRAVVATDESITASECCDFGSWSRLLSVAWLKLSLMIKSRQRRLNKAISARSQSFFLYSEPIYRMSKYYRDEMESREVCYSSADMVSLRWLSVVVFALWSAMSISIEISKKVFSSSQHLTNGQTWAAIKSCLMSHERFSIFSHR